MNEGNDLKRKALYLMSGDSIPCEVTRIDQKGVSFTSPLSSSTFVPNEKVKAVELTLDGRGPVALTRSKRDRLLTVPRMQKGNPPTHLVRSRDGDYLRGRILEMDESKLLIEVRLATQEVPRERISRIIWLHPDEDKQTAPAHETGLRRPARAGRRGERHPRSRLVPNNLPTRLSPEKATCSAPAASRSNRSTSSCSARPSTKRRRGPPTSNGSCNTPSSPSMSRTKRTRRPTALPAPTRPSSARRHPTSSSRSSTATSSILRSTRGRSSCSTSGPPGAATAWRRCPTSCGSPATRPPATSKWWRSTWRRRRRRSRPCSSGISGNVPVALDRDGGVAAKYGVTAIPQTVIIGLDGKVVRRFYRRRPETLSKYRRIASRPETRRTAAEAGSDAMNDPFPVEPFLSDPVSLARADKCLSVRAARCSIRRIRIRR